MAKLTAKRKVKKVTKPRAKAAAPKKNIGAMMAGGGDKKKRDPNDYTPTPEGITRAFIPVLKMIGWPKSVWEPACGKLHMAKELRNAGFDVWASDLIDRGVNAEIIDFLKAPSARRESIVTNPPFKLADEFIYHALDFLEVEHMALLLPAGFWHAAFRAALWHQHTPSMVMPITTRIDATGQGQPTMNVQWTVWTTLRRPLIGCDPLTSEEKNWGRYDKAA